MMFFCFCFCLPFFCFLILHLPTYIQLITYIIHHIPHLLVYKKLRKKRKRKSVFFFFSILLIPSLLYVCCLSFCLLSCLSCLLLLSLSVTVYTIFSSEFFFFTPFSVLIKCEFDCSFFFFY